MYAHEPARHQHPVQLLYNKSELLKKLPTAFAVSQVPFAVGIGVQASKGWAIYLKVNAVRWNPLQNFTAISVIERHAVIHILLLYVHAAAPLIHSGTFMGSGAI